MSVVYIAEQGAYLRLNAGRFVVTHGDKEIFSFPESSIDKFVLFGNVQVSTQAIGKLLEMGLELVFLSRHGRFKGILMPGFPKNPETRLAQYQMAIDPAKSLAAAKSVVAAKLLSESDTLAKWRRNSWLESPAHSRHLAACAKRTGNANSIQELLGLEARAAKIHFDSFAKALPPPFSWNGRSRNPPRDPVNALLSLTYMMLLGEIVPLCHAHGLDPQIGFLHQIDYSRPSLALDILEPFRAKTCDHFVLKTLQNDSFSPSNFSISETQGCRLDQDSFAKYITLYQQFIHPPSKSETPVAADLDRLVAQVASKIRAQKTNILTQDPD